jgi:protein phosphatase
VKEGQRRSDGHGMATTLTMVATIWPRAYLVQVGDSRCYRLRGGRLERLSRDQTMAEAMVDAGALTQTAAERSPLKNMLASALGGREAKVVTRRSDIEWDDVMLLCSDGLTKHVSEAEIEAELQAVQSAETTCRHLVDLALERGGSDNVTVVVGRLKPRPPAQDGVGAGGAGAARSAR